MRISEERTGTDVNFAQNTFLMLVACALTVTAVIFQPTAPARAESEFNCATDVQFFGAAGSGQNPRQNGEMGGEVGLAYAKLGGRLSDQGRSIAATPINYPAAAVGTLLTNLVGYFDGLNSGVTDTITTLNRFSRTPECAHQRIVLAGYSQGAMVMHRVARELQKSGYEALRARVDGILLIADGDKVENDIVKRFGSAGNNTFGVGISLNGITPNTAISGSQNSKLDSKWSNRIKSVCDNPDAVCALTKVNTFAVAAAGRGGVDTHTHYLDNNAPLIAAAQKDVDFRFPSDDPVVSRASRSVLAIRGQPVNSQLNATSGNGCTVNWTLGPGVKLPEGLQLSPAGLVTGTPVKVFDKSLPLKVTARCPAGRKTKQVTSRTLFLVSESTVPPNGGPCVAPTSGKPLQPMSPGKINQPYDETWTIPQFDGCIGGWGINPTTDSWLYKFGMRIDPIFSSSGAVHAFRITGTPSRETLRYLGIDDSKDRAGPNPLRVFDKADGQGFDTSVCWGVLDDDGSYPCNR